MVQSPSIYLPIEEIIADGLTKGLTLVKMKVFIKQFFFIIFFYIMFNVYIQPFGYNKCYYWSPDLWRVLLLIAQSLTSVMIDCSISDNCYCWSPDMWQVLLSIADVEKSFFVDLFTMWHVWKITVRSSGQDNDVLLTIFSSLVESSFTPSDDFYHDALDFVKVLDFW